MTPLEDAKERREWAARSHPLGIASAIRRHGPSLRTPNGIHAPALLEAIAWKESTYGEDGHFARPEKAYQPGGRYWTNRTVQTLYRCYGIPAACSWGSWQIMFIVTWELGFRGDPWWLQDDEICVQWAIKYIQVRAIGRGASTVREIADAYNSGTHRDRYKPKSYMDAVEGFYEDALKRQMQES